jgi:hypothetical protein
MHIYHAHIIPRRPPPEADFADSCDSLVRGCFCENIAETTKTPVTDF